MRLPLAKLEYSFTKRPINHFIVDFYCKELNLAIEVDGSSHYSKDARRKDKRRQLRLESLGVKFLRFDDSDVRNDVGGVVGVIIEWIESNGSTPCPSEGGYI